MDGREIPPVQLCHISVYLLFLLRQNPVDHIAVELAVLVQLPHFLCLRQ